MGVETNVNRAFAFRSQDCYVGLKGGQATVFPGRLIAKADLKRHDGHGHAEASAGVGGGVGDGVDCGDIRYTPGVRIVSPRARVLVTPGDVPAVSPEGVRAQTTIATIRG